MSVRPNLFSRLAILGVVAGLSMACGLQIANADTLSVNSALSNVGVGVGVGGFLDDEGNASNPVTGDPYKPGDINPDDGNPVMFVPLGNSIGQGNPLVPPAVLLPGGVVPVTSDGASAQLNGSVNVTPANFSVDNAAIGLIPSGLWQPGVVSPGDANGPPAPAGLGVYIDLSGLAPGEYVLANLTGFTLSLNTASVPLGGGGSFSDPNGTLTVTAATVTGFAAGPVASPFNTVINNISATTPLAGTYTVLGPTSTLSIPSISATTYQDLSSVLPGLWAQITVSGNVVASATVPEPSTIALAGFGLVGLALAAYRRNRK